MKIIWAPLNWQSSIMWRIREPKAARQVRLGGGLRISVVSRPNAVSVHKFMHQGMCSHDNEHKPS